MRSLWGGWSLSLMDRYIASQLINPLLFSVGLVSVLGVAIGYLSDLADKVVDSNLPLIQASEILLLKVPEFTAYALPISVMLSTLLTYGRLSNDSELIAFRGCGVSLYRLIIPAVVMSLLVTGVTFLVSELVVPAANYRATAILVEYLQEEHPYWQNKDIFYPDYEQVILPNGDKTKRLKHLFFAEQFDGQHLRTLTVLEWLEARLNRIVVSDSATWNGQEETWDFFNGTIYQLSPDASYQEADPFEHRQLPLSKAAFEFALQGRDPYEMNIIQARQYMKILKMMGDDKKLRTFQVRIQQKLAFPFICVVFGVIGSALGSTPQQMSRGTGFGLSVVIIFAYYLLGFLIGSLGLMGLISPILAGWLPNILGLVMGGYLLYLFAES
ncbi:LptF/LptG family permease [Crocosphaera sp.]|uniref:LptF/LptG family permease n=1 Tax=Crocosphaera sp. TaxID=2729996 RepID=UPI00263876B1|nr:LptF/LptG family permease [Crocosphaera sp.]MDJ0578405.1 LptF/LptG family permease [Crocosphaera sp.]